MKTFVKPLGYGNICETPGLWKHLQNPWVMKTFVKPLGYESTRGTDRQNHLPHIHICVHNLIAPSKSGVL